MAFAKKKARQADPISDRARALNEQISSLESEIKRLDTQLQRTTTPKFRSTAIPHGETIARKSGAPPAPKPVSHEPVFEEVKSKTFQPETDPHDRYNDLGVRKYDLPALWERLRNHFRRPTTNNPRLVNYLAAGGVHGLRPMRYEKRIARRRFIVLAGALFLLLLGTLLVWLHGH
jgi:uncharacterized small protein (DUF1192 family)